MTTKVPKELRRSKQNFFKLRDLAIEICLEKKSFCAVDLFERFHCGDVKVLLSSMDSQILFPVFTRSCPFRKSLRYFRNFIGSTCWTYWIGLRIVQIFLDSISYKKEN